jgi:glycosyltransferase involved in cell wall biosynthesis
MAKVLLLTVDVDLPDAPVNGGVLRVRQLRRHLEALGHEVVVSMPFDRLTELQAPPEALGPAYPEGRPQVAVEQTDPDVILCEQWYLASVLGRHKAPLWLDLHGSLLGENAFRQAGGGESPARYDQETRAKLRAFGDADVITCAGHRQRLYFRGWRAIAGRSFADWEVFHLPLAIEPRFPETSRGSAGRDGLRLVYAGNLWPWIDLESWLPAFFDVVAARPEVRVDFFVDDPLRQRNAAAVIEEAAPGESWKKLHAEKRVRVRSRLPHDEYVDRVASYDAAVDLFAWNSERELALTTRTLEFLSFGLPVIYPAHAELAETISDIEPRWSIETPDHASLGDALDSLSEGKGDALERIRSALGVRSAEALERCRAMMSRLEGSEVSEHQDPVADRRLVSLANDAVRGSFNDLRERLDEALVRSRGAEARVHDLEATQHTLRNRCAELQESLDARNQRISALEATAAEHDEEREAWRRELRDLGEASKRLAEDHARETETLKKQLAENAEAAERSMVELREQSATTTHRLELEVARLQKSVLAHQIGAELAAARPELAARGIGRRLRLGLLFVDHLLVRLYLGIWQTLKKRRVFPGM